MADVSGFGVIPDLIRDPIHIADETPSEVDDGQNFLLPKKIKFWKRVDPGSPLRCVRDDDGADLSLSSFYWSSRTRSGIQNARHFLCEKREKIPVVLA